MNTMNTIDDLGILSFFNGEVQLAFDSKLHAYYRIDQDLNHILIPGVTTITGMVDKSGPLTQWAANMTIEYLIANVTDYSTDCTPLQVKEAYERYRAKPAADDPEFVAWLASVDDGTITGKSLNLIALAETMAQARLSFRAIKQDAADVGHAAHEWLEQFLKWHIERSVEPVTMEVLDTYLDQYALPADDRAKSAVTAALDWFVQHQFSPVFSERKIYSREYDYAGTLDWLAYATIQGERRLVLGDFKTSNALHDEYRMQLEAYNQALREEMPELGNNVSFHILLRIGKEDGKFEAQEIPASEFEYDLQGFLGALATYCWKKQLDLEHKALKPPKKTKKAKITIPAALEPAIVIEAGD